MRLARCSCDVAAEHTAGVRRSVHPACIGAPCAVLPLSGLADGGVSTRIATTFIKQRVSTAASVCVRLGTSEPGSHCGGQSAILAPGVDHQADSPTACLAALPPPAQQHATWPCCWLGLKVTHPPPHAREHAASHPNQLCPCRVWAEPVCVHVRPSTGAGPLLFWMQHRPTETRAWEQRALGMDPTPIGTTVTSPQAWAQPRPQHRHARKYFDMHWCAAWLSPGVTAGWDGWAVGCSGTPPGPYATVEAARHAKHHRADMHAHRRRCTGWWVCWTGCRPSTPSLGASPAAPRPSRESPCRNSGSLGRLGISSYGPGAWVGA